MLAPAWGLFSVDTFELIATIRHETKRGAENRFAKAHMIKQDCFVAELDEPIPGVTEIPAWIKVVQRIP